MAKLQFDPVQLGNLEVGWWKAHNDKDKPRMARLLTEQNMALYGFTEEEARDALQKLVEGVSLHDTREWDKASSAVAQYYQKIKEKTGLTFEPKYVAELEVGWWKLHDTLENDPDKSELAHAFTQLHATQFGIDPKLLLHAGFLKAEATREHDLAEDPSTPKSDVQRHWDAAKHYLIDFYTELLRALDLA